MNMLKRSRAPDAAGLVIRCQALLFVAAKVCGIQALRIQLVHLQLSGVTAHVSPSPSDAWGA